jgi:type I restriction enzyme M protein
MLKSGGEAGVILPDSIFSSKRFREFRQYLIVEHNIKKVIELPSKIFNKTEAKTHILIFNKERVKSSSNPIELRKLLDSGKLSSPIFINELFGIERLDYSYHTIRSCSNNDDILLGSIIKISRGRLNSKEVKNLRKPTIHITDINSFDYKYTLQGDKDLLNLNNGRYVIAEPGDILMARVGRNFHEKIVLVNKGYAIASDCLFIIKCSKNIDILYLNILPLLKDKNIL